MTSVKILPNALGIHDTRRVSIRIRVRHPSALAVTDTTDVGQSDPGRSGSISPYVKMDSMMFDNSLYENEKHYTLAQMARNLDTWFDGEIDELIIDCDDEELYNNSLDILFHMNENKVSMWGVTGDPLQIIVEKDPRENHRKFDEGYVIEEEKNHGNH